MHFFSSFRRSSAHIAVAAGVAASTLVSLPAPAAAAGSAPPPRVSVFAVVAGNEPAGVYTDLSLLAFHSSVSSTCRRMCATTPRGGTPSTSPAPTSAPCRPPAFMCGL